MTVLEALSKFSSPHPIFNDRLGVGRASIERLLSNMEYDPARGCWLWKLATAKGYGVVRLRKVRKALFPVHRLTYQIANGPIEDHLQVHHQVEGPIFCTGRICGCPDHVLPLTAKDHLTKYTPTSLTFEAANRNHCAAGHEYTIENTWIGKKGGRVCLTCARLKEQAKRDRLRGDRPKFKKTKLKTHCFRGHPLEGDNLYLYETRWGTQRRCRACVEVREAVYKQNTDSVQ